MEYEIYITKDNDRWDLISFKHYQKSTLYEKIMNANPDVDITSLLPSGLKLKIPVLSQDELIETDLLPPWKRNQTEGDEE